MENFIFCTVFFSHRNNQEGGMEPEAYLEPNETSTI